MPRVLQKSDGKHFLLNYLSLEAKKSRTVQQHSPRTIHWATASASFKFNGTPLPLPYRRIIAWRWFTRWFAGHMAAGRLLHRTPMTWRRQRCVQIVGGRQRRWTTIRLWVEKVSIVIAEFEQTTSRIRIEPFRIRFGIVLFLVRIPGLFGEVTVVGAGET